MAGVATQPPQHAVSIVQILVARKLGLATLQLPQWGRGTDLGAGEEVIGVRYLAQDARLEEVCLR